MQLRPYQQKAHTEIIGQWAAGSDNVLAVLPTGAGKTVLFAEILRQHVGCSIAIAHRQELVEQISLALARNAIRHRIIGPRSVVKSCVEIHIRETGTSFFDPSAPCGVAGVDTLIRRAEDPAVVQWLKNVTLWVQDEAHHVQQANKWGKAVELIPRSKGLGVTATPIRADGCGLSRETDGLFDAMVLGPTMRELINAGYLTEYRILAPPSDIELAQVKLSNTTGDFNANQLRDAVRTSSITGDIVGHYLKHAPGLLGITFATDVETATTIAEGFNAAGVPAEVVSAKTPAAERAEILDRFKRRELLNLVNVDLFGEGFDLPAIEVVSMGRPTQSFSLFVQQFGRALRLMEGKSRALIIDHVGNVLRHGLPDAARVWTMDRAEKRGASTKVDDSIPVTSCLECLAVYERIYKSCPECGHTNEPAARTGPQHVDGDLAELDAETLAAMRGDVEKVDRTDEEVQADAARRRVPHIGQMAEVNRHRATRSSQEALRACIDWWAGVRRHEGRTLSESYRLFWFRFGIDVLTAQTLKSKDADALAARICTDLGG